MTLSQPTIIGLLLLIITQLTGCATTETHPQSHATATATPKSKAAPTTAPLTALAKLPPLKLDVKDLLPLQKVVVELYDKNGKSNGAGVIIATLNNAAYILTLAHLVKNLPQPRVNIFYRGDYPAKVVSINDSSNLALLKVDSGKWNNFSIPVYWSYEVNLSKSTTDILTIGFPQNDKPWLPEPLTYSSTKNLNLLFAGNNIDAGHAGAPVFHGQALVGLIAGSSDWVYAISPKVINTFIQAIIPEGRDIITQNNQRQPPKLPAPVMTVISAPPQTSLSAVTTKTVTTKPATTDTSSKPVTITSPKSAAPAKVVATAKPTIAESQSPSPVASTKTATTTPPAKPASTDTDPKPVTTTSPKSSATMVAVVPIPKNTGAAPVTTSPANPSTSASLVSPLYEATIKSLREQSFGLSMKVPTPGAAVATKVPLPTKIPLPRSGPVTTPTAAKSRLVPLPTSKVPDLLPPTLLTPPPPPTMNTTASVSSTGNPESTLLNTLCKALASNDLSSFRQDAMALPKNSNLSYLASNVIQAASIQNQQVVLEHSLKFLFEAFSMTKQDPKSNCSSLLLKVKAEELEVFKASGKR